MLLLDPIKYSVGVGPALAKKLESLGINTIEDLIHYYPFRYDDFSNNTETPQLKDGDVVTLRGEIWSISNTYTRSRKVITKAIFNDSKSSIDLVWFHQPYLEKSIPTGTNLQISGKVKIFKNKVSIIAPKWEKIGSLQPENSKPGLHTGRLVPIYPETYGLNSKWIRQRIAQTLPKVEYQIIDPIPENIREEMLELKTSLKKIHFPENFEDVKQAKERLSFDELFYIQLATLFQRSLWQKKTVVDPWKIQKEKVEEFIGNLPFELTSAQRRVTDEIIGDLAKSTPMNRLVQGEVGSGKTVVAAVIIYIAYLQGVQSVLMAPTEILAFQHHKNLQKLLEPYNIKIGIYTGSRKSAELKNLGDGSKIDVVVGTHALLSEKLILDKVGLVIVDEQQRFGVAQRTTLRNRSSSPHFLTMTATPIPRTVALTLYGDLDISVIDELPGGRIPIKTHVVPHKKRGDCYEFIYKQVKNGQQIYIITPLIDESETNKSAKAAIVEFERLKTEVFPDLRIGLLHGRLKSKEKEEVINLFKDHLIDILVSTSVVEVGVDVPNATVMLIEGAEKFGLAQLHQLRGRVGRGSLQSYTFLFAENEQPESLSRLKFLEETSDGLKLAQLDLQVRGSGELFGNKQSGRWELKIADLSDINLIQKARTASEKLLQDNPSLDKYPQIKRKLPNLDGFVMPD